MCRGHIFPQVLLMDLYLRIIFHIPKARNSFWPREWSWGVWTRRDDTVFIGLTLWFKKIIRLFYRKVACASCVFCVFSNSSLKLYNVKYSNRRLFGCTVGICNLLVGHGTDEVMYMRCLPLLFLNHFQGKGFCEYEQICPQAPKMCSCNRKCL